MIARGLGTTPQATAGRKRGAIETDFAVLCLRFGVASIFLVAGLAKVRSARKFRSIVENYHLLPPWAVTIVAVSLPRVEVVGALLLMAGIAVPIVSALLAGLLLAFAIGVAINLLRDRRIECGCLGASSKQQRISWWIVLRNITLSGIATIVALRSPIRLGMVTPRWDWVSATVPAAAVLGTTAVLTLLLIADWIRMSDLSREPPRKGDTL
jgi:uncharacterized membrane protein YphA (DoxX/SURF4 family)